MAASESQAESGPLAGQAAQEVALGPQAEGPGRGGGSPAAVVLELDPATSRDRRRKSDTERRLSRSWD
jgi:hypothetical protein